LGAKAVGFEGLPTEFDSEFLSDENLLKLIHRLLLDIHIIEGTLVCPESSREFLIENGIPIMRQDSNFCLKASFVVTFFRSLAESEV